MASLGFKSACEHCSKSKTKCSGGNPCTTCEKKSLNCFYAFKKKRGPKPGLNKKRTPKKAKPNFMSTYEKRVWTTFFTIFKNLKKSAKENRYSWQWFVVQLCRLDMYVRKAKSVKGRRLREVLSNFYKTVDIDPETFCNNKGGCPIPPHLCATCSSQALLSSSRSKKEHSHSKPDAVLGITQIPGNISVLRGQRALWEQWQSSSFDADYESNSHACLVYECTDESFGVFVNEKFVQSFGYDSEALTKLLMWSGGGFLPWGGDILAALLVKDTDLLLYLKVMATKYQTLANAELKQWQQSNLGDKDHEETVLPFLEEAQWWCSACEDEDAALQPKLIKFTSTVRIKKRRDDNHKVFLRYELKALTQVTPAAPVASMQRLEDPLVPYEDLTTKVASEMNRDLWPLKEESDVPEFNLENLDFLLPVSKDKEDDWELLWKETDVSQPLFDDDEQWLQDLVSWAEK